MKMKNITGIFPLLSVIAIIGVAGCTSTGGGGPGVVILNWEPDLRNIFSDDNVDFLLKVQNQGESRARNVIAEVTNIDLNEWGAFQRQTSLSNLIPYDPVTKTDGETKTYQFTNLKAPKLTKGTSFTYEPTVRLSYDYTTTAQKPITIVDRDELIRIQQQGKSLPTKATTYTSGPLVVDIAMGNYVKTSDQFSITGQTYDIFPVQIKITNTQWGSGGSVTPKSFGLGGVGNSGSFGGLGQFDYPVLVKVTPPTGTNFVFSGFGSQDCSNFQFTVELFQGKQGEVTCELEVTTPPAFRSESLIQVELDYRYFIDAVSQVTVQGTKEVGGLF